jgi:hypothetical protein
MSGVPDRFIDLLLYQIESKTFATLAAQPELHNRENRPSLRSDPAGHRKYNWHNLNFCDVALFSKKIVLEQS